MGLFNKGGMSKYNITTSQNGNITNYSYTNKKADRREAKILAARNTPEVQTRINDLKQSLSNLVSEYKMVGGTGIDSNRKAERGDQLKGRLAHHKDLKKKIDDTVSELRRLGCSVNPDALKRGKIVYKEGVENTMFSMTDIKSMKLDIFEENAAGKITDNMRDYMLTVIESVTPAVERMDAYLEAVAEKMNAKRDHFVKFVQESLNVGLINMRQHEVLMELAQDDFMFEGPQPEDIPAMVMAYIEAAKEGNEEAKAEIKKDIDEAKEVKEMKDNAEAEAVTEGADCSIVEKLESLKCKLTDEEKAMAEKFDQMIADGMKKEAPAEEPTDDEDEGNSEGDAPVEGETPAKAKEEKTVKESVEEIFEKVSVNTGSRVEAYDIMNYMLEAVKANVMSEEDFERMSALMEKTNY